MKDNYFILFMTYDSISLFTEIDGKITNVNFVNGHNKLSNCVTFSYDKEDLEFLPDGDPFEIDKNSSFSEYLDFAGYHFEDEDAIETIVGSIIKNKMIPNLSKSDDILICRDNSYYETKDENKENENIESNERYKKVIEGHSVYYYDIRPLFDTSIYSIRNTLGNNFLTGFPFFSLIVGDEEELFHVTYAPTLEKTITDEIDSKNLLPTHLPEKLFRNVKNRIIVSKIYQKPLPDKVIYQNRTLDIGKAKFAKYIDELLEKDNKYFAEKIPDAVNGSTYIFDFGMHPAIRDGFISRTKNPILIDKSDNIKFISYILRNMVIQHTMINNLKFKASASFMEDFLKEKNAVFKYGPTKYYELHFIREYCAKKGLKNPLSNYETKCLADISAKLSSKNE